MSPILQRACLIAAAAAALVIPACGGSAGAPSATQAPSASASGSPGTAPQASSSPQPQPPASAPAPAPTGLPAGYQPLYPFASLAAAQAWETSFRSGGHQPWHLNAAMTTTSFTAFLGYTDVNQVAYQTTSNGDAHVAVGIKLPNGKISTAAVVHLLRFGSDRDAPWEVVGTDDTTLSLDTPTYGALVSSPVTAGGTITGVDESIRVQVFSPGSNTPAGTYCCRPAGGTKTPWSASVTFGAAPGQVLTIAASTGGHVAAVERFTVTGVRAG